MYHIRRVWKIKTGQARSAAKLVNEIANDAVTMAKLGSGSLPTDITVSGSVSYTHLRAHETPEQVVWRLLV